MDYREPLAIGWVIVYVLTGLILLGALISFGIKRYYAYRSRKGKSGQPKTMTAVTAWLAAAFVLIWGGSMVCLTIVQAEQAYRMMSEEAHGFLQHRYDYGLYHVLERWTGSDLPLDERRLDYWELETVSIGDVHFFSTANMPETTLTDDVDCPTESAVLFYDAEGKLKYSSRDLMIFSYQTEEEHAADPGYQLLRHNGWIDLSVKEVMDEFVPGLVPSGMKGSMSTIQELRITGTFSGMEMTPLAVETMNEETEDREEWRPVFDRRTGNEADLITVYTNYERYYFYEKKAVTYERGGESRSWESLEALVRELDFPRNEESSLFYEGDLSGLGRILVFSGMTLRNWNGWEAYDESGKEQPLPPVEGYMVTACQFHPLKSAVASLRTVYIVTGLVSLAVLCMIRSSVKKRLAGPLARFTEGMEEDWRYVYQPDERPQFWREAEDLSDHYQKEKLHRTVDSNEITRLNTALNYARAAEETRRQQTSALAHDLKTPLAVIHSHAEGLKARIAEERRDEYLSIILSETERMDEMVMGLLDLSRLEAGKIRLSADEMRLDELAAAAAEKLSLPAMERGLTIELKTEPCPVTADEARIGQVIDNLLSNALRYAPADTVVKVTVRREKKTAVFTVENGLERPFTEEELRKIWESFYRGDASRNTKGSGLGLAIAKSIIELHGGRCTVKNVDGGVVFGFELPV